MITRTFGALAWTQFRHSSNIANKRMSEFKRQLAGGAIFFTQRLLPLKGFASFPAP
jgi:hypothetical protein